MYVLAADCGDLLKPQKGNVLVTRSVFGSVAEYSCDHGYKLIIARGVTPLEPHGTAPVVARLLPVDATR